jgi:hypothetical protein
MIPGAGWSARVVERRIDKIDIVYTVLCQTGQQIVNGYLSKHHRAIIIIAFSSPSVVTSNCKGASDLLENRNRLG